MGGGGEWLGANALSDLLASSFSNSDHGLYSPVYTGPLFQNRFWNQLRVNAVNLDHNPIRIARSTCTMWSESRFESTSGWGSRVNGAYDIVEPVYNGHTWDHAK